MLLPITDPMVSIQGLPWIAENSPDLFRFPGHTLNTLPARVAEQARYPAGGRLLARCDSATVAISITGRSPQEQHAIDVYLDGRFLRTVGIAEGEHAEVVLFEGFKREMRQIECYLPYRQEVRIEGLSVEDDTRFEAPRRPGAPLVVYGSSIAQGVGATRSSMSYEAILSRRLGFDFVNLGFGGAGKAEAEVVDLITSVDGCCYLFDLGKSYGHQSDRAYRTMLERQIDAHPDKPIIAVTPIYSTREMHDSEYAALSRHTRDVVCEASASFDSVTVVDGTSLLGPEDSDGLGCDGVHPSEYGYSTIAERLEQILRPFFPGAG